MFILEEIHIYESSLIEYINFLNSFRGKTLEELVSELRNKVLNFDLDLRNVNVNDKGLIGKLIKKSIFGLSSRKKIQINDEIINIRTTNIKCNKNLSFQIKERLTLSNINVSNYYFNQNILNKNKLEQLSIYQNFKNNILFTLLHKQIDNIKDLLNIRFLGIFTCNFDDFLSNIHHQLDLDFNNIKSEIQNATFQTSNQKYIHLHKHGNKGSVTRALGLKGNFVKEIIELELLKEKFSDWNTKLDIKKTLYLNENILDFKYD